MLYLLIQLLVNYGLGTRIGQFFFGCLLYADDILLVSHSLHDLQAMLDLCAKEAADLDFTCNAKKSVVLSFSSLI